MNSEYNNIIIIADVSCVGFEFGMYESQLNGKQVLRSVDPYRVPEEINHLVEFVVGIHGFPYQVLFFC